MLYVRGTNTYAHRYAWERAFGPISEGMTIDHQFHCDPACCEINHLREATHQQNMRNRRGASAQSRTGIRGVIHYGSGFAAQVKVDGVHIQERHTTIEEAAAAAPLLRRKHLGAEFAGGD